MAQESKPAPRIGFVADHVNRAKAISGIIWIALQKGDDLDGADLSDMADTLREVIMKLEAAEEELGMYGHPGPQFGGRV